MKFAKQLEDDAVPEWRSKYFDYKGAKKLLKAVGRAHRNTQSSTTNSIRNSGPSPFSSLRDAPVRTLMRNAGSNKLDADRPASTTKGRSRSDYPAASAQHEDNAVPRTRPIPVNDRSPLRSNDDGPQMMRYGSIIGSPPTQESEDLARVKTAPSLELPFPALDPSVSKTAQDRNLDAEYDRPVSPGSPETFATPPPPTPAGTKSTGPKTSISARHADSNRGLRGVFSHLRRTNSTPGRPMVNRMFSGTNGAGYSDDVALEQYNELDARNAAFRLFLDKELDRIEEFYKSKEDEAVQHLDELRQQLHVMRDQRAKEIASDQKRETSTVMNPDHGNRLSVETETADRPMSSRKHRHHPFGKSVDFATGQLEHAIDRVRTGHVGKTSRAMGELGTPTWNAHEHDYQRRFHEVSYRSAKSSLKRAFADYYRHLEFIKAYALLNRTAFRKINKKYDKTVHARPKMRYMDEKVSKSHFVSSGVVEDIIQQVEDLYARYFERGNHKLAVGKLRQKIARPGQHSGSVFRVGVLFTAGCILAIQALVYGLEQDLQGREPLSTQATYLLQIYAGYFLGVLLTTLFALDCGLFTKFKINYQLIFELDSRHNLDWKELAEIPAVCMCLLGVIMLLNFQQIGGYSIWHWIDPPRCNSSHSALLGFFTTLPGIWRLLQCLRRFYDEDYAWFPHLVNGGKYTCTIMYYLTLSLYRQNHGWEYRTVFIFFAALNAVYCTIWDLYFDWSLDVFNLTSKPPLLRSMLVFRRQTWMYYLAILFDIIIRFNWILYAIFTEDLQHSSAVAFFVALTEIFRRAVWVIFRVENEHISNIRRNRAVRPYHLPYKFESEPESQPTDPPDLTDGTTSPRPTDLESAGASTISPSVESPVARALKRVGTTMMTAHARDYEKKKDTPVMAQKAEESDEDDDDDDDDEV
nr:protein syg1 [Quercus suber]